MIRRCYEFQSREMNHVKRLAKRVLDQRSHVEQFFLEALSQVRKEIARNRLVDLDYTRQSHNHCHFRYIVLPMSGVCIVRTLI